MRFQRRELLQFASAAVIAPMLPQSAFALAYPTRPIKLVVGFPPGFAPDMIARLIGQSLSEQLGQTVVVENRPGAEGNIATDAVARAAPDGYTLLLVTTSNAINATLYDKTTFNFLRDIKLVASTSYSPFVMVVAPSFPAKTVPEFIAYGKENPGKINAASIASTNHMASALFQMMTGVEMVNVNYREWGAALGDITSGRAQVTIGPLASSLGAIQSGQLRALAVTTNARLEILPNIPTVAEFVLGYEVVARNGIGAPMNTPPEIIERLNKAINASLDSSSIKAAIAKLGNTPSSSTPEEYGKVMADETVKWAKVIKFAGIQPN